MMQGKGNVQGNKFTYSQLPQKALTAAINSLVKLGYDENAIIQEYRFSSNKNDTVTLNALAFAHPSQRDLDSYASVTMINAANGHNDEALVTLLAESSAPFHLIHRKNEFSLWASSVSTDSGKKKKMYVQPVQIERSIKYEQMEEVMNSYGVDIQAQRVIEVKQGRGVFTLFPHVNPLQLSLWAEEIRSKPLVHHFENAINLLRNYPTKLPDDTITFIATQLLGLLILADTGMLGENIRRNRATLRELIFEARNKFPNYFDDHLLLKEYPKAVEEAYTVLQNIQYSGFVPDMLGDLYAVAYEPEVRKKLGNYDTPLYLTRHILNTIPVEYLPPQKRVIADFTCGWGSFLIAAYERLSNVGDADATPLQQCLFGNDYDTFFTQLTKLGLIYETSRDDWHIDNEDLFQWKGLEDVQPDIIIGNPPFAGNRKEGYEAENVGDVQRNKQKRAEKANKFLEHAVEQLKPGGYLALIMPRSFAVSEAGPGTRKKLLEACDILELWELPAPVFKGATVRTMVIFAQKKAETEQSHPSQTCIRTRTVQPITLEHFESAGTYTSSALVTNQSTWAMLNKEADEAEPYMLDYKTILPESTWLTIRKYCLNLGNCAITTRGIALGTKRIDRKVEPKVVAFLPDVRHVMNDPYVIDYSQASNIMYPDDCERPRLQFEALFREQKILLQYVQTPSWGKRVKLAIERRGVYPSDHYWAIAPGNKLWPNYTLTNEILAAILEWDVSNAWIIEHMKSPGIPSYAINTIPIPTEMNQQDCTNLSEAFLTIEQESRAGNPLSLAVLHARSVIDTILKAAYQLDENTFQRLRRIKEWEAKPAVTLDLPPDRFTASWFTSGIVDEVFAERGAIRLWLDGFEELQVVNIAPSMPGWMLRPGTAFLTTFPIDYIRQGKVPSNTNVWGLFLPQPYMYMSEEELLTGISQQFVMES